MLELVLSCIQHRLRQLLYKSPAKGQAQPCVGTMRVIALLSALCAAALVQADFHTAQIYVQPVENSESPSLLAEVAYDPSISGSSSIISYEAPEIPESTQLVRVGLYDVKSARWISGTTVASVDNFGKGYSPNLVLSVDEKGELLSAALKGVRIDAGQTRDFGPQAVVLPVLKGKQPELNKPIVLSPEGKKVEEVEKTPLQKYWWVIAIIVFLAVSGGGGEK